VLPLRGPELHWGERLLVHRDVREEFVGKLARLVTERVVLGDPFDERTTMGPLNNSGVAEKMDEHVADALERGAELVSGGSRAGGFPTEPYWQATVLDLVPDDSLVAREETFGPVAPVVAIECHLPFGGRSGTASGIGRVGGGAPMESFTELRTVVIS
jgi:acyl-CoA reductase-like NAD-dependent aldehyde dehydrogenase